jgi:calcium-dependent protein kinase
VCVYLLKAFLSVCNSETEQEIFDEVLKGDIDFKSSPWPSISDSAKDLIRKMFCSQPSERLTAQEVLCMFNLSVIFFMMLPYHWENLM